MALSYFKEGRQEGFCFGEAAFAVCCKQFRLVGRVGHYNAHRPKLLHAVQAKGGTMWETEKGKRKISRKAQLLRRGLC
jgi:hypothetical protein